MPPLSTRFQLTSYDRLPGWEHDRQRLAFDAFRRSAFHVLEKPYRTGALGVSFDAFTSAYAAARAASISTDEEARAFFEHWFTPAKICGDNGEPGFVTAFYEPEVEASLVRTSEHVVPLLQRPEDLIDIDDVRRSLAPGFVFGRKTPTGIVEYFDRKAIEQGALAGRARPVAWLKSKVDAFFIHVQGAARLHLPNGETMRVTYAAKSGHPFTGPGRVLAELGEIPLAQVTMQSIRAWLAAHPDRVDEILWKNRSYIFFHEAPVDDPTLGPVAAAKVPLTPGRSLAVDRLLHTFGTPFFISALDVTAFEGRPFERLMIAQDTGSAIVGPARGDLFAGSGHEAGETAGVVRNSANFVALLPRDLIEHPE